MNKKALRRLELETQLKYALERGELSIQYLPIVSTVSGVMVGAEALLRWENAELGYVSPSTFIPIAEETGLIGPIGEWVLIEACREAGRWRQAGNAALQLAVNVSSRQFWGTTLSRCGRREPRNLSGVAPPGQPDEHQSTRDLDANPLHAE